MAGAKATKETTFDAPIDKVWAVVSDYESYPEFVDGVSGIKILDRSNGKVRVEYSLNMIKKLTYILNMEESAPNKLSWSFEKGDIFKVNAGSWELTDLGNGKTGVVYNVEVEVKGFFPGAGMIVKTLTEVNLPNMLKAYEARAEKRLGKMMASEDKDKSISEVIKKVVSIGVGAAFMTEDAVKKVLADLPLPKEIVNGLLKNAQSVKEDFVQSVRSELSDHLSKVDPKKLMEEVLENYDIDVQAKVKFTKKK